ncbi:MAG: Trk system potassium transporter TrkA [Candidatus Pelagibacter sp.]|nr:Trk system potassium transporter TrkA [Candidatus Pelagibacter sp.]|tara:strand:+ start:1653 stop:3026 length:1374 start_codon:yes stop_codon:yes gene_type:complete
MNIIICGAGQVGYSIADQLSQQGHSITVIDKSSLDIQKINDNLDAKGIVGIATFPNVLELADAKNADMIIAVTRNDETNMIVCQIAHSLFNISRKIARIRSKEFLNPSYSSLFSKSHLPIDIIISPEYEVAKSLLRKIEAPGAIESFPFVNDLVRLVEINLDEKCPLVNTPLQRLTESFSDLNSNVLGVQREDKFLILKKKNVLIENDKAFILTDSKQVDRTMNVFGKDEKISDKILIIGAGNIGLDLAKSLEDLSSNPRIKIIEKNEERAQYVANELNETMVIKGDGLDENILKEVNLEEIDTVLCITDDDEVNLMSALLCKKSGIKRVIAIANSHNYSLLQTSLKIDDIVDPRMTTVSTILKHIHKGKIDSVFTLDDGEFEIIEAKVTENSELINQTLEKSSIPEGIRIGLIVREKKVLVPKKDFEFKLNDIVILLSSRANVKKVEQLFRISEYY